MMQTLEPRTAGLKPTKIGHVDRVSDYKRLDCICTRDGNQSGQPAPSGQPELAGLTGTARVDRPVGSRFFDRPVKSIKKPSNFSFLQLKYS